jgi:type IV secretion system protein VirB4
MDRHQTDAALIAPGVVLNKDGSFQRTARFRGPDLDSATPSELVGTTARLNNALRRLGSGWAIFVEAQRNAANRYPDSRFPNPVSALVDAERRGRSSRRRKAHFERANPTFTKLHSPCPSSPQRQRTPFEIKLSCFTEGR